MAAECPYLEYRPLSESGDGDGDGADEAAPRAYCTAADRFVQAMRADVCNDRYDLDHETDCEIYRDHEGLPEVPGVDPESDTGAATDAGTDTGTGTDANAGTDADEDARGSD